MLKNIIVTLAAAATFAVPSLALASQGAASSEGQAVSQKNVSQSPRKVRSNRVAKADDKKMEAKSEKKVVKVKKGSTKGTTTGTATTGTTNSSSSTTPVAPSGN